MGKIKKILIVLAFLVIVIGVGYLLYKFFFKPLAVVTPPPTTPATSTGEGGFPTAGPRQIQQPITEPEGGLPSTVTPQPTAATTPTINSVARGGITKTTELGAHPTKGVTVDLNGKDLKYYNPQDGKFYRITKNGKVTPLSDKIFHQVKNIVWSPTRNEAILEFPDGANILYDFDQNRQVTLPKHWEGFDFAPNGRQIVLKSIGLDPDNRWLAISNADGSRAIPIEFIGINADKVYPSWSPNNQVVALYLKGVDFDRQEVFFVGKNQENFKSMIIEGRGAQFKWSPKGDKLLYSAYSSRNQMKPMLWVSNAEGDKIGSGRRSLKLETWAEKCAFANDNEVYCAVPEKLPPGAGLDPQLAKTTKDRLYRIDLISGTKKLVAIPDKSYNISDLFVTENNTYLYFTDSTTGRLHKLRLK